MGSLGIGLVVTPQVTLDSVAASNGGSSYAEIEEI